jgi:predicted nucleic acid-binding protein
MATPSPVGPTAAVIDTNVAAAWSFPEAGTALADRVRAEIRSGRVEGVVPSLFWAEFQHVCKLKLHPPQGEALLLTDVEAAYESTLALGLTEVPDVLRTSRDEAWELIKRLALGSYDAYFLALACDLGLDVWTLDASFCDKVTQDPTLTGKVKLVGTDVLVA